MLRGFRWQLVALLTAASLFVLSLAVRLSENPAPPIGTPEVTAEATSIPPTQTPLPVVVQPIESTPVPDAQIITFSEALVGNVQRLNPVFAPINPAERDITSLIFEGLTRTNAYGEPEAALAESWVVSSDGLEYTVRLRQDVLWQDGIVFDADDVVYTMSVLRSPEFTGPDALGEFWRTVETEKLGEYLVRFRLTQPLGSFLDALTIGLLPVHALEGIGAAQLANHPFNLTPIGTGPYQLEALRIDPSDSTRIRRIDLRVAPVFRQRPEGQTGFALDRISFLLYDDFTSAVQALQSGAADALAARERAERLNLFAASAQNPGSINLHTQVAPELGVIIFNWNNAFFREQRVRLALERGIDRSSVVERTLTNQAILADSPIAPGSWAYLPNLPWPPHDPNSARTLLETAQQRLEVTPTAESTEEPTGFGFSILVPNDPALVQMAQEIATQWSQYGMNVTVDSVELESYHERLNSGQFDAALAEFSLGDSADPDVYPFWHQGQTPPTGENYGGVNDTRISEILERARQDRSGLNRIDYYREFQREFVNRAIAIPMYYPLYSYATTSAISGVQLGFMGSPDDRFRNIQAWTKRAS